MKRTVVTAQVLEMLLENWGVFVTTDSWGPAPANQCGSAERRWNSHPSRYAEGYKRPAGRKQADDALGIMMERVIADAPIDYVRPLLHFYGYEEDLFQIACSLRISRAQADSLLIMAKAHVKQKLEGQGYEQATYVNR